MVSKAWHNWVLWGAAAAAVVSLGVHGGRVVLLLSEKDAIPVARPEHVEVAEPQIDLDRILALMPFGQPVGTSLSDTAPASDFHLVLVGVVRADPMSRSSAIVSVGKEPARRFFVGDEIAGGRRLVEVQTDHVLLKVGDLNEVLSLRDASPPALPQSDGVSRTAGATGDLDALRKLIFDQARNQGDAAAVPSPVGEVLN